ncbi:expressed unknown protein [Seminavis robusta]|uniref:Uncharacterized protein n=1 Tax=Seminavis robusta TaxID=568900 RepID=A0A9N8E210_9STRA|nr:expressed unknown protein [Seminavis robusta]|eukprot:Sro539_g162800.1 n/a (409) ;mRNA; f:17248-18569
MIPHFSSETLLAATSSSHNEPTLMRSSAAMSVDATTNHVVPVVMEGPASKRQKGSDPVESGSNHSHTSTVSTVSISSSSSGGSASTSTSSSSVSSRLANSATFPLAPQQAQAQAQQSQQAQSQPEQATPLHSNVKKQARRHVSFAPVTSMVSNEWSREEVDAGWYTKDELSVLKQERKALVKVLKKVRFDLSMIDQSVHCLRGYEAYLSIQANKEYKAKRQMVWESVLREQARQRYMRISDPLMMQLVSGHATQWARDTATELGMKDAQVALAIFVEYMHEQQEDDIVDDDDDDYYNYNYNNNQQEGEEDVFNPELLLEMPLPVENNSQQQQQSLLEEDMEPISAQDCFGPPVNMDESLQRSSTAHHRNRFPLNDASELSCSSSMQSAFFSEESSQQQQCHVRRQRPL